MLQDYLQSHQMSHHYFKIIDNGIFSKHFQIDTYFSFQLLVDQFVILETMTPLDFLEFR